MAITEIEGVISTPGTAAAPPAAPPAVTATATPSVADEIKPYRIHVSVVISLFIPPLPALSLQNPRRSFTIFSRTMSKHSVADARHMSLSCARTDFFALPGSHETEARDSPATSRAGGTQVGVLVGAETATRASH